MTWQEYCNQASQLVSHGRYQEAERIILQAFKEARESRDPQHVYLSLDLLGWLAFMQQKYADAEKVYQHVVNVKIQLFGRDHVEIAKTMKNLIAAAYQLRQYERVVGYASEAARIFAGSLGTNHPECQQIAKNLVEMLKWLGRTDEAETV
ncbi:MAG: tetratricopeptide repeat protein, partial [Cyanobacteria bacterium]|nr:tetratricopeptide repeat protein [Cyanobacteriota bacterium]